MLFILFYIIFQYEVMRIGYSNCQNMMVLFLNLASQGLEPVWECFSKAFPKNLKFFFFFFALK